MHITSLAWRRHIQWIRKTGRRGNRVVPCITHTDGSRITESEARDKYGFKHLVFWDSTVMFNCKRMEEMLQELYQDEPWGTRRCWSKAGAGANYPDVVREESTCLVYLTYSRTVQKKIHDKELMVGDLEKTRAHDVSNGRPW
jgi:hypothetical protein